MKERIDKVFSKTLEDLKQKIETKSLTKKDKPHMRPLSNIDGLKSKYNKLIHDINVQIMKRV